MIRVGIIGCGKMADQHVSQIRRIHDAEVAAVCDAEVLMAQQLSERFAIARFFVNPQEMLESSGLDVVHITTPPESHAALGKLCLEHGCNIYVEKPFTLETGDAVELIQLAERNGLRVTAGHNAQFTPAMVRMRALVKDGYLGGKPVHIESHYCYGFGDAGYATAMLGDSNHWVRKLPGSLLQNIISHGISKIAEFISGDNPRVIAIGFTSAFLQGIGQGDITDEVRVIIQDDANSTAYFTFSSQIIPVPHRLTLYGPGGSLVVDDDCQALVRFDNSDYKSYLKYFVPPLQYAKQYVSNFGSNVGAFIRRDFHLPNDSGLKTLIEAFYASIMQDKPPPIPYREILVTSRIMDSIFAQIRHGPGRANNDD